MPPPKIFLSRAWPWLVPLAVGAAAYFWPVERQADQSGHRSRPNPRPVVQRTETDALAAYQNVQDEAAVAQRTEREKLRDLDGAARREKILKLIRREDEGGVMPGSLAWSARLEALCADLVEAEGVTAIRWLDENAPGEMPKILTKWADRDEAAVFDFLTETKRSGEYPHDLALQALAGHVEAAGGTAEALLDGVKRLPWGLFKASSEEGAQAFDMRGLDGDTAKLWVDSGAERYLAAQGVEIQGIAGALVKDDPGRAVGLWMERVAQDQAWGDRQMVDMIMQICPPLLPGTFSSDPWADPEMLRQQDELKQALLDAGPDARESFHAALQRLSAPDADLEVRFLLSNGLKALQKEFFPEGAPPDESSHADDSSDAEDPYAPKENDDGGDSK